MKKQKTIDIASAMDLWLSEESASFTAMCGERVTHREVLQTLMGIMLLVSITWIAEYLTDLMVAVVTGGEG